MTERLRVGIVAPLWAAVPPTTYGGIARHLHLLVNELVRRGHDVTLFCEEHPADVAAPLLLEPRGPHEKVHFDDRLGFIRRDAATGKLRVDPRDTSLETDQRRTAEELASVVPESDVVVLADEAQWVAPEIAGPRPTRPFLERDGQYWGAPADDATAIAELERMRREGARFLAVGWPAFWGLEHYRGFADHLRTRYACRLESERLVVFDLA